MRSASCQSTRSATRLVDPRVLRLDDLAQVEHHDHDGGGDDQRDHEDQGDPPVPDDCEHGPTLCRSEEHTSELQSLMRISYAVFCLKNKNTNKQNTISRLKRTN